MIYFTDVPVIGPVITGTKPTYNPGDILSANCTSFNSFPAATLNWYINGQAALEELQNRYPETVGEAGLKTVTSGLRFGLVISNYYFHRNNIQNES